MGFVADEHIAAIGILGQPPDVGANAFVAGNEHVEQFGPNKGIEILFDRGPIRFGNGERLDDSGPQPFDKFVFPIFDEGTGTDDNDPLGRGRSIGRNARFEHGVDETDAL